MNNSRDVAAAARTARYAATRLTEYLVALESCTAMSGGHPIAEDAAFVKAKYDAAAGAFAAVSVHADRLITKLREVNQ